MCFAFAFAFYYYIYVRNPSYVFLACIILSQLFSAPTRHVALLLTTGQTCLILSVHLYAFLYILSLMNLLSVYKGLVGVLIWEDWKGFCLAPARCSWIMTYRHFTRSHIIRMIKFKLLT